MLEEGPSGRQHPRPWGQPSLVVAGRTADSLKFQQENYSNSWMLLACQTWWFLEGANSIGH